MQHRHLTHESYTLAAIDDIIARGKLEHWRELRTWALADEAVREKILRICKACLHEPYAQRHHFWRRYVERLMA
jgi:hypothetical protein